MKCEICGADACYMVAVDSGLSSVLKGHVRKFAGRCKKCEGEGSAATEAQTSATKGARSKTPYERLKQNI